MDAGIVASRRGKVRRLKPEELPEDWDPANDTRLTVWEMVHHWVRALGRGEQVAADLVAKFGAKADIAGDHACHAPVQIWPEIVRLPEEDRARQRLLVLDRDAVPRVNAPEVEVQPAYEWLLANQNVGRR